MNFIVDAGVVAVIVALVSGAKTMGFPSRFAPLLSLALGVVYYVAFPAGNIQTDILFGLIAGLSSSGLYSGVKALATPTPPTV